MDITKRLYSILFEPRTTSIVAISMKGQLPPPLPMPTGTHSRRCCKSESETESEDSGGRVHVRLIVDVALLLLKKRDKAIHFLGRTVPHLDLVLRPSATHLHWSAIHP